MKNLKPIQSLYRIVLLFMLSIAVNTVSLGQTKDNTSEITDQLCTKGIDIDQCSHIPLYVGLYEWLGTPYKYSGTTKKGIDCSGFTKKLLQYAYGIELTGGSRDIYPRCKPVTKENLNEGDLVFFKIAKNSISHVGVYLQKGFFVHASVHGGVMISNLGESYYSKYFYSGGRV